MVGKPAAAAAVADDGDPTAQPERFAQSVSRARAAIFELAACNHFEWFCSFTLDDAKRDRHDLVAFRKDFAQFIRDQNKRRDPQRKIRYLLIPEQHKDGAWHMHGLFMGLGLHDLVRNEYGYLDWPAYRLRFGFFSCSRIRSRLACSKYITKYVTKDFGTCKDMGAGAHLFFASQGLQRRQTLDKLQGGSCPYLDSGAAASYENDYVRIFWTDANQ